MNRYMGVFFFAFLLIWACKKEEPTEEVHTPTPYTLETPASLPPANIPDDNPLTVEGIALGKMLFFDPVLSGDSTQSCGSCHNQADAFTDNGKTFSEGIQGLEGTRNSMPLYNLMYHKRFFWDGRAESLREQALLPIQDELEMDESLDKVVTKLEAQDEYKDAFKAAFGSEEVTTENISLALEQFMNTLVSGDSKFDRWQSGDPNTDLTESEMRGFDLFFGEANPTVVGNQGADCFHCHGGPLFSNNQFMNNGLDEESAFTDMGLWDATGLETDKAKFKVPSLRNIAVTAPYMHDGRFATLEEVLDHYNEGIKISSTLDANMQAIVDFGIDLDEQDKQDLINFLHTLTDEVYLNNSDYHSPFE